MVRLSALVCVHNQEAQLSECLRGLFFCDEIVVVADRCTDRSQEIARRHGAVVIDGIFPLENQRKAAGLAACSGEWILEIEPDELVDRALAWEIRAELQRPPAGDWFEIPIDNYIGEDRVRAGWTGSLSATGAARLFRNDSKRWKAQRLQDGATLSGTRAGELKGAIRRVVGEDVGRLIERLNRLVGLRAEDLADASAKEPAGAVMSGLGQFFESYLRRGGWREGRLGVLVALLSALFPLLSQMRAREVLRARRAHAVGAPRPLEASRVVGLAAR